MPRVPVEITRFVDSHFPGWIEFVLLDAYGIRWTFVDKVPALTEETLSETSDYPRQAALKCEVVEECGTALPADLVTIDTSRPFGIETQDGTCRFVVHRLQLAQT